LTWTRDYLPVGAFFAIGLLFNIWVFSRSPFIPGVDGPYYLIQVRGLLKDGHLVYGDPPLAFYLFAFFALLPGDLTLGVELGASVFCALAAVPIYFLMKQVSGSRLTGLTAMLLVIFSAPMIRMMTDFMKNAVGVFFVLSFLYYLHRLTSEGGSHWRLLAAASFLILAGLTHVLALGVAVLLLLSYLAACLAFNVKRRAALTSSALLAVPLAAFIFIASAYFPDLFSDFSKGIAFLASLLSPQRLLTPSPAPQAPPGLPPRVGPPIPNVPFSLPLVGGWGAIIAVLFLGAFLADYEFKRGKRDASILLSATTIVGLLMGLPFISADWLNRFLLMEVIPFAVILSFGAVKLGATLKKNLTWRVAALPAIMCVLIAVGQSTSFALTVRPTIDYAGYNELNEMKQYLMPHSIITGDMGLLYWVEYVTGVEIAPPNPGLWDSYSHVYALFLGWNVPAQISGLKPVFAGRTFILFELPNPPIGLHAVPDAGNQPPLQAQLLGLFYWH